MCDGLPALTSIRTTHVDPSESVTIDLPSVSVSVLTLQIPGAR
jgi:hypothetical protein